MAAADTHYRDIVARIPSRAKFLRGWLRRNQHVLARFVDSGVPEDAMGPLSTPATPRVPAPRSLQQILADLTVTPTFRT